ncbi:MATE family efflux transporter [Clostridium sp. D53t1_180928_C8]|uniref:MATE family efflux transporter n=1 Tax=Clostridium sp. D53t1_180928_C8 TaxID=2787101 RepID=UPI001FACA08E|nr:MATE family efflux transporter [Clostridium sp. D53t1_180928_C8]
MNCSMEKSQETSIDNYTDNALDKKITAKSLFLFSLPSIIGMVFMNLYTMVDGMFVSRLVGTDALSAINIVFPIIMTVIAISTMLSTGGNAIISKKMGERKESEARKDFSTIVFISIALSVIISILSFIFINPLLKFLGANDSIYNYCFNYAVISLIFLPATMFSVVFQTFFITIGKANLGLTFTIIGGVSNVILDYVFIKVLNFGISGAAIATGIGYSVPGLLGLAYFIFNRKNSLYIVKTKIFNLKLLSETCINGSSEMVSSLSASIVTLLFNNILMRSIGVDGVAAVTVILYIQGLLVAVFMGYSMGCSPLISFNYGKKDNNRLHKIYKLSLIGIIVTSILVFMFGLLKSDLLVSIFTSNGTNVYKLSNIGLKLFSISFLFMGLNLFTSALFTALSNGKISAIISFLRTLVFIVISVLVLPLLIGINGVWLSVPVAELLSLIVSIFYLKKYKSKYKYA